MYLSNGNLRMNIPTWSIPAETTCPNATSSCKKNCYAKKAERMYRNTRESRKQNLEDTKKKDFVYIVQLIGSIDGQSYHQLEEELNEIIDGKTKAVVVDMALVDYVSSIGIKAILTSKKSFEKNIEFEGFSNSYHAVFIRAPVISKIWNDCKVLSKIDDKIIAARQDKFLAFSFHPELTDDVRIHKYFLDMI